MNDLDFWNRHSVQYLEMAYDTGHKEMIHDPDGYGKRTGECGDTVEFFIKMKDGMLDTVSFMAHGCLNTTACCNTVVSFAREKPLIRRGKLSLNRWWIIFRHCPRIMNTAPSWR